MSDTEPQNLDQSISAVIHVITQLEDIYYIYK